jgi:hypothetical protein
MMRRRTRPFALAPVLALAIAGFALAAPAPPAGPGQTVRERLSRPVTLTLHGQSLRAAVDALREAAKVDIVVDTPAIQQLGFTPEQPPSFVDIEAKDEPARVVLRRVVDHYGLAYAVVGDAVVVSTEDGAATRQLRQRVDVDFDRAELAAALKKLAGDAGVNLALDPRAEKEASAKVSLRAEDMPLETAVRLLAEMAGLKTVRIGNVLFVTTKTVAAEMRQDAPPPPPVDRRALERLGDYIAVPVAPAPSPPPPPGVPPAVPPTESGDRR